MKHLFVFALLFVGPSLFSNPNVDILFNDYAKPGVPGASVVILKEGKSLYEQAYGLQNLEENERTTIHTNYRLASVSKQFTAMAVLILIQQNKLTFETNLKEVFPDFPSYGAKIKIRHLLGHTSGLKDYEDMVTGSAQVLDADVLALMKKQTGTLFTPGSKYQYSNGGYCVLSQVVENISGLPFAEFTQKNIFDRIGMKDTQFFVKDETVVPHRAYGYSNQGNGFVKTDQSNTSATMGDGGVYTSVSEWVHWDNALSNATLLPQNLQDLMFTPGTLNDGTKTQYGFGYVIDRYKGNRRQSHTGSTIGFRTAVQRFPDKGLTVLVLINRANSSPWAMAEKIADLYLND